MSRLVNFPSQLSRQLGFLERSCQSYDAGYRDEAIRIATVVRILVHQTKDSTSLLKHLGATTINLLSTTFEPSSETVSFVGMGMMKIGNPIGEYLPHLGSGPINDLIPASKWWSQVVLVLDEKHRITRRSLVLAAANKDGGAHVDRKLTEEYAALAADGAVGSFIAKTDNISKLIPMTDAHLVSLRQIGYEVTSSSELRKFCNF